MADPNGNGRIRVDPRLAVTVIGWVISIVLAWGLITTRVAVVETKQNENERRLIEIERKIDELLRRP